MLSWDQSRHVERVLLRPKSLESFVTAMFWLDALADRTGVYPELVLPYVPGARQDRRNPDGDFLFTAKSVAKMVNERKLKSVTILDPHSDVVAALIDHCRVHTVADILDRNSFHQPFLEPRYAAIVTPDGGAEKRAGGVAQLYNLPLIHAWKKRDTATGKLTGFGIESVDPHLVEDGRFLVVDDICDGGGTFLGLANEMQKQGISADLYVTHGIFSQGTKDLLCCYNRIFCTDSTLHNHDGVTVLPYCAQIA